MERGQPFPFPQHSVIVSAYHLGAHIATHQLAYRPVVRMYRGLAFYALFGHERGIRGYPIYYPEFYPLAYLVEVGCIKKEIHRRIQFNLTFNT